MRFTIELPDELFRVASPTAPQEVALMHPGATGGALSGGPAPGEGGGVTAESGATAVSGLSAGPAEHYGVDAVTGTAIDGAMNGGAAPGLAENTV